MPAEFPVNGLLPQPMEGAKAVLTDMNMSTYEFLGLGSIKEAKGASV